MRALSWPCCHHTVCCLGLDLSVLPPTLQSARSKAEKALRAAPAGASQEVQSPGASSMQQNAELAALRQQAGAAWLQLLPLLPAMLLPARCCCQSRLVLL